MLQNNKYFKNLLSVGTQCLEETLHLRNQANWTMKWRRAQVQLVRIFTFAHFFPERMLYPPCLVLLDMKYSVNFWRLKVYIVLLNCKVLFSLAIGILRLINISVACLQSNSYKLLFSNTFLIYIPPVSAKDLTWLR